MRLIRTTCLLLLCASTAFAADDDVDRLIAAMLGDTPVISDLQELTDTIGGRVTGTAANEAAVDWAVERFIEAEVGATAEPFEMPMQWQERALSASIGGDVSFDPHVVAKPFSAGTRDEAIEAPLLDGGTGTEADFERLADSARSAWVLGALDLGGNQKAGELSSTCQVTRR